jgi:S1-C subfamily serine protease
MKKYQLYLISGILAIITTVLLSCNERGLDTKLIVSKYGEGVVKILLLDTELEKVKEGSGYRSRGSGFFVTKDGYIFTNRHVVEKCVKGYMDYDYKDGSGKTRAKVATYSKDLIDDKNFLKAYTTGYTTPVIQVYHGNTENDYKLYLAEVVAIGMGAYDGAILKVVSDIDGNPVNTKFTALPLGNSDEVVQGEQLCVYGYPMQFQGQKGREYLDMLLDMSTLSIGIMSGLDFVFNKDYGFIKTDAEIHGGNSGGPVFNEDNKVIGIATAYGRQTNIGLVGGINGMYFISASNIELQQKLISEGLKPPIRSFSINTTTGEKTAIKTVKEINAIVNARNKPKSTPKYTSKTSHYANASVWFSNISPKDNNNYLPQKSKRYTSFSFSKAKGGKIWVYVDNYPKAMNTSQVKVYIDKLKNGKYVKHDNIVYNIKSTSDNTYFSFTFYEKTTYKFRVYSKENRFIGSGTFTTSYK